MLKTLIGPSPSRPSASRSARLSQPAFGPIRKIHAIASTGVGTSSGNRMSGNQSSRPGRSVRSISQASAEADGEHERHRAGDEDEGVRQDARIDDRIVDQRAHVLERPLRTRLERQEVRRPAERREQQHRERHRDQIDRRAGAEREHQLGRKVEVVGFVHARLPRMAS